MDRPGDRLHVLGGVGEIDDRDLDRVAARLVEPGGLGRQLLDLLDRLVDRALVGLVAERWRRARRG